MNTNHADCRFQTPQELAGQSYESLMRSKEDALQHLSALNDRLRIAAILVCESVWNCANTPTVVEAARKLVENCSDDSIRLCAMDVIAREFCATGDREMSTFLATVALNSSNRTEVRAGAYWALREVQFGVADESFDGFLRGVIHTVKPIIRMKSTELSEEVVRSTLVPEGHFPDGFWDSADNIDWEFVRCMAGNSSNGIGKDAKSSHNPA